MSSGKERSKTVWSEKAVENRRPDANLHMQRARNHVAHKEIHQTLLPRTATANNAPIPDEKDTDGDYLEPPSPAAAAGLAGLSTGDPEVVVREAIEVESREGHDDVEETVLDSNDELCKPIKSELSLVVGGVERFEESWCYSKEREVLDIWVTGKSEDTRTDGTVW